MSSGSGAGQRKEASVQRVITVPAYYPAGYDFSPFELAADRVAAFGGGGSAGGEGTGRPGSRGARSASGSRPHSYRVRTDGTIYATTAAAIAKGLDVNTDTIVAISPRVPTPCRADVSVVLLGPEDKVGGGGAAMALGGGPLSYNFFTLPTVDFAAPRTVCILPPPLLWKTPPPPLPPRYGSRAPICLGPALRTAWHAPLQMHCSRMSQALLQKEEKRRQRHLQPLWWVGGGRI